MTDELRTCAKVWRSLAGTRRTRYAERLLSMLPEVYVPHDLLQYWLREHLVAVEHSHRGSCVVLSKRGIRILGDGRTSRGDGLDRLAELAGGPATFPLPTTAELEEHEIGREDLLAWLEWWNLAREERPIPPPGPVQRVAKLSSSRVRRCGGYTYANMLAWVRAALEQVDPDKGAP